MATHRELFLKTACVSVVALVLSVLGCSEDVVITPTGTTGTATGAGVGGSGGTGGAGGAGGAGGEEGGGGPVGEGDIVAKSGTYKSVGESEVRAYFRYGEYTDGCTDTFVGNCAFSVCNLASGGAGGAGGAGGSGGAPPAPNAGTIVLSGGLRDVTLTPEADGKYLVIESSLELFAGGETISFEATGADIRAFSGQVTAPSRFTMITPDFFGGLTIDTNSDLTLTWTGGPHGVVTVLLFALNQDTKRLAQCIYPASAGTGTVPSALLDDFLIYGTGTLWVCSQESIQINAGNFEIGLWLSTDGASATESDGKAHGTVIFE